MPIETQWVTLVPFGGTPVRLANQHGAPYPTTGQGSLVFSDGPQLTTAHIDGGELVNPTLINATILNATFDNPTFTNPIILGGTRILVAGAGGTFYLSDPVVSTQSYTIRSIFQTPGKNTCSVRLDVIPQTTPTHFTVKIAGGLNGTTRGIHPADGVNWTLLVGADAWTFELVASQWVIGSVFYPGFGVAYVPGTIFDSAAIQNTAAAWARAHAPATVYMPLGGKYVQSAVVRWPESTAVIGQGDRRSFSWLADARDQPTVGGVAHIWGCGGGASNTNSNIANAYWYGEWLIGNREHGQYGKGQHLVDLGGSNDTGVPITLFLDRMGLIGGAGYCMSWGGENGKFLCTLRKCVLGFPDSDTIDCKNRLNSNLQIEYDACVYFWHAMNTQGTGLEPVHTTTAIPITVTAGSRFFTVSQTVNPGLIVGDIVTIAAPTFHSLVLSGDRPITSTAGGLYQFQGGPTPSGNNDTSNGIGVTWRSKDKSLTTLASIPITTVSGSTQFTILKTVDPATQPGETATMVAPVINGLNPNGSLRVVALSSGAGATITLDTLEDYTLALNPITPNGIGTAVVNLNMPGHGRTGTTKVQIVGATNGSGLTINPATAYDGTVIDVNTVQTTIGGVASSLTAFGGSPVVSLWTTATSRRTVILGSDPFSVINSNTTATVHDVGHGASANDYVTFSGATGGFAGLLAADLNKQFKIVSITDVNNYTITLTATPNATITGGGAAVLADYNISSSAGSSTTFTCPHISDGDTPTDMRGVFMVNRFPYWEGELFGRNGFRGRGGTIQSDAGEGATCMCIVGARGRDLSPSWVKNTSNNGNFLQLIGVGQIATNIGFQTSGGASIIVMGSDAIGCLISDFYVDGSILGLDLRGDFSRAANGVVTNYGRSTNTDPNIVKAGASLDGQTTADDQFLKPDPYTPLTLFGASPTLTNVFAEAHGRGAPGTHFTVQFAGFKNTDNGLALVGSNQPDSTYAGIVIDANNYTVPIAGSATSLAPFGGDSCRAIYGSVSHVAQNIQISNVTFVLNAARTSGSKEVFISSHANNPQVTGCHFYSSASENSLLTDNSLNNSTTWGPGNVNLPNLLKIIQLPADGSGYTLKASDAGATLINPPNAAALNIVTLPDNSLTSVLPPGFWCRVQCRNTTGANGVKFQTIAGTITDANASSSNPGFVVSSTTGASCRIDGVGTPGYAISAKVGTWALG